MEQEELGTNRAAVVKALGKKKLLHALQQMLRIRNLEIRGEAAYQQGEVGGFYHAYIGQEAVQTALVEVVGSTSWYSASYRVHALALLLGATPNEIMAEFYGRETGNAKGRGGSMHLYTETLLGGAGIVGGQIPIGTGAGFSLKYLGEKDKIAVTILGDGAVAQGTFHESLNIASLWDLPCLYLIENNHWGMGTGVDRAISVKRLAEEKAPGYGMKGYTLDGMDFFACYEGFKKIRDEMLATERPAVVEVVTERFRGHSVSDPALYRSKEELGCAMERDPIVLLKDALVEEKMLDEEAFKAMNKEAKEEILAAVKFAEESPWPDPMSLEEGVYAP